MTASGLVKSDGAPTLSKLFQDYFEIVPANTPELLDAVFKLRYEVFCAERIFDPKNYVDGLERDVYDDHAVHSLLYHRPTGLCAGAVRLVLADAENPDWKFPLERVAEADFDHSEFSAHTLPRHQIGEVSRFCLSRFFRARQGEQCSPDGLSGCERDVSARRERRALPHPVIGLIAAAVRMCWDNGVMFCYAAMEQRLDRRLQHFGLFFEPISPEFDYCGRRRAYVCYLPQLLEGVHRTHPEVWALLTEGGTINFSARTATEKGVLQEPSNPLRKGAAGSRVLS